MKYKFNYNGDFFEIIKELLMVNIGFIIFLGIVLFCGMKGNEYYTTTYSVANMGIISYMILTLTLWINGIVNLLLVIRHTIKSIEVETTGDSTILNNFNSTFKEKKEQKINKEAESEYLNQYYKDNM